MASEIETLSSAGVAPGSRNQVGVVLWRDERREVEVMTEGFLLRATPESNNKCGTELVLMGPRFDSGAAAFGLRPGGEGSRSNWQLKRWKMVARQGEFEDGSALVVRSVRYLINIQLCP